MSSLFDAGDFQRLDREATLTEQAPRQLPAEDRSPIEEPLEDPIEMIIRGLMMALERSEQ
jgi:hypothetical protein